MRPISPDAIGKAALKNPKNRAALEAAGVHPAYLPADEKMYGKARRKSEKELEREVENWLSLHGYHRLTAENADCKDRALTGARKGWFGHWPENKRNPLMPDVAVFNASMTACLMVELKCRPVYQPGQKSMILAGIWKQAWTLDEFMLVVQEWESLVA